MLLQSNEERAETLMHEAREDVKERWQHYRLMAAEPVPVHRENGHA